MLLEQRRFDQCAAVTSTASSRAIAFRRKTDHRRRKKAIDGWHVDRPIITFSV